MTAAFAVQPVAQSSPRFGPPRILWLLLAMAAAFAAYFLAADFLAIACYAASTVLVYDLFAASVRKLALTAMSFSLLAFAIGAIGGVFQLAVVIVLKGAHYLSLFTEPLRSLALSILSLRTDISRLALALFAIHCVLAGYLILRRSRP
ncbi:MAG TPA: DUF4386 family protein [Gemmatimonadaceae bacterium]|nr:MAG: hypothetical protein DMF56_06830 [Acidobacteriota bacterium]HTD82937.1 DUF4386 family protein [Gemmatimonadaceae bacterium]